MGSSVHLHETSIGRDVVMVVAARNMTRAEVDMLGNGAAVTFTFPGAEHFQTSRPVFQPQGLLRLLRQ